MPYIKNKMPRFLKVYPIPGAKANIIMQTNDQTNCHAMLLRKISSAWLDAPIKSSRSQIEK